MISLHTLHIGEIYTVNLDTLNLIAGFSLHEEIEKALLSYKALYEGRFERASIEIIKDGLKERRRNLHEFLGGYDMASFYNTFLHVGDKSLVLVGLEDGFFFDKNNSVFVFGKPVAEIIDPSSERYDLFLNKLQQKGIVQ